jgi:hypothetical protein
MDIQQVKQEIERFEHGIKPHEQVILGVFSIISAALIVGAYLLGAHKPARVEVKTEVQTRYIVQSETVHDQVKVATVVGSDRVNTVVKYRWLPGGTVEATETRQEATTVQAAQEATDHENAQQRSSGEAERVDSTVTTPEPVQRPRWSLALMPGVDLPGLAGHGAPANLLSLAGASHVVLGVSVERHIIGPMYAGVWANTSGMAGLTLRGEL